MNNAENLREESIPNIYGASAVSRQHLGNGFPLAERSNHPVDIGSVEDPPPQYVHLSNASSPPVYAVVHKNRSGSDVVQSEASAPAADTAAEDESIMTVVANGTVQPSSAPPARPSLCQDITLIDNDLYEKPSDTVETERPTTVSNAPAPPVYAMVRKNRSNGFGVQSEASAPAGNTADNGGVQPSAPPARPSLYQDITLIDNDLYE